ncbi:DEAD/DEAH box helicase [Epibacterium ulvae]|uniref:DEAD/DEAH box helicase n=1 Tax=Epibacterium ulvae TaxID=1156985 RepID=UPI0024920296|nr:DEAD/DEAH box helicase [Epibacterium ulvae]
MTSPLFDALKERGYETLTSVQEAVTAPDLETRDLLVSAQTGSGKTVGFGLAIAPTLLGDAQKFGPAAAPLALVIAPTRELALQVMTELRWLYGNTGARIASCVGGMDARDERRTLERGVHIVVGTPGRLCDHINRGALDMTALQAIVLDEADEMLDLGFREDLEFMLGAAPEERRTLLFSATVSPMIAKLAEQFQNDAQRVSTISAGGQHSDITYQALRVAQPDAENAIINVLRFHEAENAIVFANTRAAVNRLTARLSNRGFSVVCLSGELSQSERSHALQAMRDGRARVCVATDVAARGIDLPKLELVIHADLPTNTEALLHRSGRTGRAGRKGFSALIVPPKMTKRAERLLKWAKVKADWQDAPSAEAVLERDEERLLADPAWNETPSEVETTFAAKLVEAYSPEQIAAAYLRLYRTRHSAPEELLDPGARPERKERKDRSEFGPSKWVSLSIGREQRAEPRWLLPLLCRAANLNREQIGAIRVQSNETLVEIAEPAMAGLKQNLPANSVLEDDIKLSFVEGTPDLGRPQPHRKSPRGDAKPRFDKKPRGDKPAYKPDGGKPKEERKPWSKKPADGDDDRPKIKAKPASSKPRADRNDKAPRKPREEKSPRGKSDRAPQRGFNSSGEKLAGKFNDKPSGKSGGKPKGSSEGKPSDKPSGKFGKAAYNPSARLSRKGKPGGKPGGKSGGKPGAWDKPRRK